jgi:hypothetical protein
MVKNKEPSPRYLLYFHDTGNLEGVSGRRDVGYEIRTGMRFELV